MQNKTRQQTYIGSYQLLTHRNHSKPFPELYNKGNRSHNRRTFRLINRNVKEDSMTDLFHTPRLVKSFQPAYANSGYIFRIRNDKHGTIGLRITTLTNRPCSGIKVMWKRMKETGNYLVKIFNKICLDWSIIFILQP